MENEKDKERNLRLRMEDEKDKLIQEELVRARIEIKNQLSIAHKTEIEKLQARFKSITNGANMERSSSELSLEKSKVSNYLTNYRMVLILYYFINISLTGLNRCEVLMRIALHNNVLFCCNIF